MPLESQQVQQKKKMGRPRKFDDEFRRNALERMKACEDIAALAGEMGVSRPQLYRWRNEALGRKPKRRPEAWVKEKADERQRRRLAELERLVARQALELDFFKGALQKVEARRQKSGITGERASTTKSKK